MSRTNPIESLESRLLFHGAGGEGGTGLQGEYFDNANLTTLKMTRTDPLIAFNWGTGSPSASIGVDTFSVRWTGKILAPNTENYTFTARVDDGVRLWIGGTPVIDAWVGSSVTDRVGSINLNGGVQYDIKLEYFENYNQATCTLSWQTPTIAKEIVPTAHLYPPGATPAPQTSQARIDSGSTSPFTDSGGKLWSADAFASGGWTSGGSAQVAGTVDDALYNTRRYGSFSYGIPIDNGNYTLKLYFMDPSSTAAGQRKFDVFAENQLALDDFDIVAAGGALTAVVRSIPVSVTDGKLDVRFAGVVGNATVSAVEVIGNVPTPAATIDWTQVAPSPIARAEALRAVVDNKLYVFGGFNLDNGPVVRMDRYDPATNSWAQIGALPERLTHTGVAVVGRNVYFAGGYVGTGLGYTQVFGTKHVWRYNVDQNQFFPMPDLPVERAGGGLVEISGKLHYFGGDNLSRNDVGDHYVFNLSTNGPWTTAALLPSPRSHMGYIGLNGKIYAIGGQKGNDDGLTTQSTVSVYDSATDKWTDLAPLPLAVSHISSSTVVLNGNILVFGGEKSHGVGVNNVFSFDPISNVWSSLTPLPAARISGVAGIINGEVYFSGGSSTTTTWKGVFLLSI